MFEQAAALETDWAWLAWALIVLFASSLVLVALTALALIPKREM